MLVNRVEQHLINKKHELFQLIDEYSFKTKNLYNYANYQVRQTFIITSKLKQEKEISQEQQNFLDLINSKVDEFNVYKEDNLKKAHKKGKKLDKQFEKLEYFGSEHKYLGYDFLEFLVSDKQDYRALMAQVAQQVLKLLDKNWDSFFESIKDWKINPYKYNGMPKLPKYKHKTKGRFNINFTNQNCSIKGDSVKFPRCFNQYKLTTNVTDKLQQVRIKPLGGQYLLEVVYQKEILEIQKNSSQNIIGIDLGLNNFVTITNNIELQPIVINGRIIKSINQYYNKQMAYYKAILKKETGKDWSKQQDKLTIKRNNKTKDFIHKTSRFIINYCIKSNIDTIVIGNNKNWKQEIELGKKINQNFVQIPYSMLIKQLEYKAQDVGIKVIVTEESYTSKASFIDNDSVPEFKKEYTENYIFSGKRIRRGLYRSLNGILINADVNGSYNIIKKVFPKAFVDGIEGVGLHPIKYNIA
jgi:putative transposase